LQAGGAVNIALRQAALVLNIRLTLSGRAVKFCLSLLVIPAQAGIHSRQAKPEYKRINAQ
jgi:hypothetical protein